MSVKCPNCYREESAECASCQIMYDFTLAEKSLTKLTSPRREIMLVLRCKNCRYIWRMFLPVSDEPVPDELLNQTT